MREKNMIDNIATGKLVLHCISIDIYQKKDSSIKLSGHGTIKINNSGALHLELICTSATNINTIMGPARLPHDLLNEDDKLHMVATTMSGDIFSSNGFSIRLGFMATQTPSLFNIGLSHITKTTKVKYRDPAAPNYLYFVLDEESQIPKNRINSTESSLDGNSLEWNQTCIDMNGYTVTIINRKSKVEIEVSGEFVTEKILEAIKFYVGLSNATMPQPFYILDKSEESIESIISTSLSNRRRTSASPLTEHIGNEEYKDNQYHYNILRQLINLYESDSNQFNSLFSQWQRVWHSFQSNHAITTLTLAVAIEGLLNDIYIPEIKEAQACKTKDPDTENLKHQIKNLNITQDHRQRLLSSIGHWNDVTATKALDELVSNCIITKEEKDNWKKLRNEKAHPKTMGAGDVFIESDRDKMLSCINLFHKLILNKLKFSGPMVIQGLNNDSDVIVYTYRNIYRKEK
ncbi:hypothetical protein [Cobetia marina]|uniref:hypothetical protein n=1 Tax=Cobetia marina TaxID=28258 RepID=UPI003A8EB865